MLLNQGSMRFGQIALNGLGGFAALNKKKYDKNTLFFGKDQIDHSCMKSLPFLELPKLIFVNAKPSVNS